VQVVAGSDLPHGYYMNVQALQLLFDLIVERAMRQPDAPVSSVTSDDVGGQVRRYDGETPHL
jgi:hypothetical protein